MARIATASAGSLADLLVFVAPAVLVAAVVVPINQATQRSGAIGVRPADDLEMPRAGLPRGTWFEAGVDEPVTLVAHGLPYPLAALTDAWLSIGLLAIGVGGLLLWRVLRAVAAGDPFRPANARLVLALGIVAAVGGIGSQVAEHLAARAVLDHVGLGGPGSPVMPWYELSLAPIVVAALLVILADAIRIGARMRADLDGLV